MPGCRLTGLRFFHVIANFIFDVYLRRAGVFISEVFILEVFVFDTTLQQLLLRFARFHLSSSRSLPVSLTKNRAKSTIAKNVFKVRGKAIHHVKVKKINFPKTKKLFTFWGITKFCAITCTASTLRKCSYLVSDFKAWNSIQWNIYHFDSDDNFSSGCRNVNVISNSPSQDYTQPRLRAVPLFSYSPSRAERKKQAARKLAARKLVSGRKTKKKGLQTKPQRLTFHGRVILWCSFQI